MWVASSQPCATRANVIAERRPRRWRWHATLPVGAARSSGRAASGAGSARAFLAHQFGDGHDGADHGWPGMIRAHHHRCHGCFGKEPPAH